MRTGVRLLLRFMLVLAIAGSLSLVFGPTNQIKTPYASSLSLVGVSTVLAQIHCDHECKTPTTCGFTSQQDVSVCTFHNSQCQTVAC